MGFAELRSDCPLTDRFFSTFDFQRVEPEQLAAGRFPRQSPFANSSKYMRELLLHLTGIDKNLCILDIGGYIGMFTIEAARTLNELGLSAAIICLEPGDTFGILQRNLKLNQTDDNVVLVPYAASDKSGTVRFAIKNDANISSKVVSNSLRKRLNLWLRRGWSSRAVPSRRLEDVVAEFVSGRAGAIICKIDTEGHEAEVISGLGSHILNEVPHILIIEYWPGSRTKRIVGESFDQFVFSRYAVFDIRRSLCPSRFERLTDFESLDRQIASGSVTTPDLLLIAKHIPGSDELCRKVASLAE